MWACPVCAAKVAAERADDLGSVLGWAVEQGHTVGFLTLTLRHWTGQRLADLWDALSAAWTSIVQGEAWSGEADHAYRKRFDKWETDRANGWKGSRPRPRPVRRQGLAETYGILGWVRAVEAPHGPNGWHPHVHVPLIFQGPASDAWVELVGEEMFRRWRRTLARLGYEAVRDHGGLHIQVSHDADELAGYLAKHLALEATHGHVKTARNGSELRAPFQILGDLTKHGDAADLSVWREWEQASKGRRQLTWSKGIRGLAGLIDQDRSDEEIAEDDLGTDDLLILDRETWQAIASVQIDLLEATAKRGVAGAIVWLDQLGLTYVITSAGRATLGRRPADAWP